MVDEHMVKYGVCALCRLREFRKAVILLYKFKKLSGRKAALRCGITGLELNRFRASCEYWEYDPKFPYLGENLLKLMADIDMLTLEDITQGDTDAAYKRQY